jgi:glutaminyl-peptide cyclotransferase
LRRHPVPSDRKEVVVTRKILFLIAAIAVLAAVPLGVSVGFFKPAAAQSATGDDPGTKQVPIDHWSGDRAMSDIAAQLRFTPRSLDQPGHQQTIDYIDAQLANTPLHAITKQRWTYHSDDGVDHAMTNIIARLDPANPHRVIVATHYDSIVRAYRDDNKPDAPMPGANNSASGVAVLLETARALGTLPPPPVGIDMIFFDGEEGPKSLGAGDPNWYALGSPYFTAHLGDFYLTRKPQSAVDFDMVCYNQLKLQPELSSLYYARSETAKFWSIGAAIAPSVFSLVPTTYPVSDDHTALARAGIPSLLVIDFDYDPWFNTTADTIDKCSAASLEAVGRTLLRYLYAK